MGEHRSILDDLIDNLADDFETNDQMEGLGVGIQAPSINSYMQAKGMESQVPYEETHDIQLKLRSKVEPCCHYPSCIAGMKASEEGVSLSVGSYVTQQSICLKSPAVKTVVGMQNLPEELKRQDYTVLRVALEDADRDISLITAVLRRTGGQHLKYISLRAAPSLPPEKKQISTQTMRELGLLVKESVTNLQGLSVSGVVCEKEEDLITLIESSRNVKTSEDMWITLPLCPVRLKSFVTLLKDAFGEDCQHTLFADLKPIEEQIESPFAYY